MFSLTATVGSKGLWESLLKKICSNNPGRDCYSVRSTPTNKYNHICSIQYIIFSILTRQTLHKIMSNCMIQWILLQILRVDLPLIDTNRFKEAMPTSEPAKWQPVVSVAGVQQSGSLEGYKSLQICVPFGSQPLIPRNLY